MKINFRCSLAANYNYMYKKKKVAQKKQQKKAGKKIASLRYR